MEPNNLEQSGASQIRPSFGIGALGAWALEPSPASLLSAAPLFCNSWPCALRPKRPKALLQRQGEGEAMLELSVDLQEALQAYRWGALKTLQKERQKEPQKEPKVPQAQAKEKRGSEALESFSQRRARRLEPRKCKIAAHRLAKGGATAAPVRFLGAILIPLLLSFSQRRAEEMSDMPLTKPID
ncbi:hypothetical protein AK812_SmicGene11966 [Symbiodinium microadriaticum]|uniref:Uncharacterized protein n=1 Tax=Symbiodinium microadriaticum TaxID=2951 RepID=A0A1Q9EBT4_SYMMI|nr:hypothetical protein AK812_SmicGene11966 [Symbiodinium microadriaticum]